MSQSQPEDKLSGTTEKNSITPECEIQLCGENSGKLLENLIIRVNTLETRCVAMEIGLRAVIHQETESMHKDFLKWTSDREKADQMRRRRRKEVIQQHILKLRRMLATQEERSNVDKQNGNVSDSSDSSR